MLASQISTISPSSISPLLQTSISTSTAMFRSHRPLPRRPRPGHQIRTIRLSLSFEPKIQKEAYRVRDRIVKHKYMEALSRSLAWNRHYPGFTRQFGFKGLVCSAWRGQDSKLEDRWASYMEKPNLRKSDSQGNNNDGTEHAEQGTFDKFWGKDGFYTLRRRSRVFRQDLSGLNSSIFSSHLSGKDHDAPGSPNSSNHHQTSGTKASQAENEARLNVNHESQYDIDPITNKKVFRIHPTLGELLDHGKSRDHSNRISIDVPVKTFKGYRSRFADFEPPESEKPKPEPESKSKLSTDQADRHAKSDSTRECLQDYEGSETYKPYFAYEPDGKKPSEKGSRSSSSWIEGF